VAAVVLAAGVGASSCGVPVDSEARLEDDANVPGGLLDPAGPPGSGTSAPASGVRVTVCLGDKSGRLHEVERSFADDPSLSRLTEALSDPVTEVERFAGLSSSVSSAVEFADVTIDGGVATVGLTEEFAQRSSTEQLGAVAQVVCTLTAQPGVGQVRFELEGATLDVPRGDGSTTSDPLSRADYPDQMPGPTG
jgi:hypothetical protein